jgi:hypothetical protein
MLRKGKVSGQDPEATYNAFLQDLHQFVGARAQRVVVASSETTGQKMAVSILVDELAIWMVECGFRKDQVIGLLDMSLDRWERERSARGEAGRS